MLIGMNLPDVEEINLIIVQDGEPIEKYGLKITNYNGRVDEKQFWHQARGIFLKLCTFDSIIGEAIELEEREYESGRRSFYVVALTNCLYPCSELDDWVPAEKLDISFEPSNAVPLRTIENQEFKLESFAVLKPINTTQDYVSDSQG